VTTNASSLTLSTLRQTFGLRLDSSDRFFDEWLNNAPTLTEAELQGLDRLTRNYTYLSQEEPPLKEIVKLVVISPLLDLAGFYQFPFLVKAEVSTSIEVADEANAMVVQGRIDILVIQDSFWILVIESKPARLDVTAGIPQALERDDMLNLKWKVKDQFWSMAVFTTMVSPFCDRTIIGVHRCSCCIIVVLK